MGENPFENTLHELFADEEAINIVKRQKLPAPIFSSCSSNESVEVRQQKSAPTPKTASKSIIGFQMQVLKQKSATVRKFDRLLELSNKAYSAQPSKKSVQCEEESIECSSEEDSDEESCSSPIRRQFTGLDLDAPTPIEALYKRLNTTSFGSTVKFNDKCFGVSQTTLGGKIAIIWTLNGVTGFIFNLLTNKQLVGKFDVEVRSYAGPAQCLANQIFAALRS